MLSFSDLQIDPMILRLSDVILFLMAEEQCVSILQIRDACILTWVIEFWTFIPLILFLQYIQSSAQVTEGLVLMV